VPSSHAFSFLLVRCGRLKNLGVKDAVGIFFVGRAWLALLKAKAHIQTAGWGKERLRAALKAKSRVGDLRFPGNESEGA